MKKGGISILGILFLGVILIIVLSYFNVSIKSVAENPTTKENVNYIKGSSKNLWTDYLEKPVSYMWNDVFKKIFWASFIDNMERIRDGKPTNIEKLAPTTNFSN